MNAQEFEALEKELLSDAYKVMHAKMQDYADADQLSNFKRAAEALGRTPFEVWAVYFFKHVCSVLSFVKNGDVASEPLRGRFVDLINYCILGEALFQEVRVKAKPGEMVPCDSAGRPIGQR